MKPSPTACRFTVYPARDDGERPVVSIHDIPSATWDAKLADALALQGLDVHAHWFVLHEKNGWLEVEFNSFDGRLWAFVELRGANTESEAVEVLRAHYRKHREELAALDAKIREENATRQAPR